VSAITSELDGLLRLNAAEHEQQRRLSVETVEAMKAIGAFRMFVPEVYRGPQMDPLSASRLVRALAKADAATAWVSAIGSLASHGAGVLEPAIAHAVMGDPNTVVCGAYAPTGTGERTADGWNVTGRWAWGSGSPFASWMTSGTLTSDGGFHQMLLPMAKISVHDTWYSAGLAGTGSHDYSVENCEVADGYSIQLGVAKPQVDAAISRMPLMPLFCSGIASVMIGIAERAVEELQLLAQSKKPTQSNKTIANSPITQTELAMSAASIRSAVAYLEDTLGDVWNVIESGDRATTDQRLAVRLAAAHIGADMVRAVDRCFHAGGGSAVYATSPLQRCFRDIHTAAAHIMVSPRSFETAGRHFLGLPIDPSSF
jgi:indole-3-acetate monooxygenase